ncbi:MAG: hypothetical protein QF794_01365, partial [Candidatus Marinimicrobia bacterium]|nr:hypothetical protein [Candidatus Neomarinimicrobiota bacterium]
SEKSALVFGYSVLANAYGQDNPVSTLQSFDRARQMFPGDKGLLQNEIDFLKDFVDFNKGELGKQDYDLIGKTINLIKLKVPESSTEMANRVCEPLIAELYQSMHSSGVNDVLNLVTGGMLYIIHGDLTVEEQVEKFSELITPILMEKLARDQKNKKKAEQKVKKVKPSDA